MQGSSEESTVMSVCSLSRLLNARSSLDGSRILARSFKAIIDARAIRQPSWRHLQPGSYTTRDRIPQFALSSNRRAADGNKRYLLNLRCYFNSKTFRYKSSASDILSYSAVSAWATHESTC
jgi:hypothetical protein